MTPLRVQPLPDDRYRFRVENEHGRAICELSARSALAGNALPVSDGESAALERAIELLTSLSDAMRQRRELLLMASKNGGGSDERQF